MLFAEEMNSFYGGPTFQPTSVTAVTTGGPGPPPMPMEAWKGPLVGVGGHHMSATMSNSDAHGITDSSKLMTKWGGHPMDYGKGPQNEIPSMGAAPFTPTGAPYGGAAAWSEPHQQQNNHLAHQQFAQFNMSQAEAAAAMAQADNKFLQMGLKAPAHAFQLQGIPQQAPPGPFTPPMDLINGQWGRGEINQCTPWNLEMNGADPSHSGPPPPHPNYRKWEQQHRGPPPLEDGAQIFGPGAYGAMGAPSGYGGVHMYGGGERMVPSGLPQFVGAGVRGPSMGNRGWESSAGANANKFVPDLSVAGPSGGGGTHRKFSQFSGPPPPLNIIPPRHPPMFGHLHPPPLFTPLNPPHATSAQFNTMGTFNLQNGGTTASNIQTGGLSEDAIWQDPNGELRKWQRDTGTSIWGDPAEQTGPIQRWQQFTAEEVVAKSNLLAKEGGEVVESGWGELPPIGNGTNSNGSNNETTPAVGGNSANQQFVGGTATAKGGGGGTTTARSGGAWNGTVGAAEGDGQQPPQQQMGTTGGWNDQKAITASNVSSQPHGGHFQITQQQIPPNNFVLPPTTTTTVPNATGGQPPSLLSMIDSNAGEAADGGTQRKAISPAHQQQNGNASIIQSAAQQGMGQTLKVSLAEELSTLGTHSMGSGFW